MGTCQNYVILSSTYSPYIAIYPLPALQIIHKISHVPGSYATHRCFVDLQKVCWLSKCIVLLLYKHRTQESIADIPHPPFILLLAFSFNFPSVTEASAIYLTEDDWANF